MKIRKLSFGCTSNNSMSDVPLTTTSVASRLSLSSTGSFQPESTRKGPKRCNYLAYWPAKMYAPVSWQVCLQCLTEMTNMMCNQHPRFNVQTLEPQCLSICFRHSSLCCHTLTQLRYSTSPVDFWWSLMVGSRPGYGRYRLVMSVFRWNHLPNLGVAFRIRESVTPPLWHCGIPG